MATKVPNDWKSIIYRGVESEELDYKAAQDWNELSRTGKGKFVRHCLAMANSKGGYIVVGVGEDKSGRPCVHTGLTEKQSRSFDPTAVGNFINNYVDPEIDLTIERPVVSGKRYAVFVVRRFASLPHVCAFGCEGELQQGVFYIRTAEASSRPAFRSHEIHSLIQRCLRNQREQLGRMLRGILYESSQRLETDERQLFKDQRNLSRDMLAKRRDTNGGNRIAFEMSCYPSKFDARKFTLSEVRTAVEKAVYLFPDALFIRSNEVVDSYSTNVSIRSLPEGQTRIWQVFRSGFFHFQEYLPREDRGIDYTQLQWKLAEAFFFIGELYSELGYSEEMFEIDLRIEGAEDALLTGIAPHSSASEKKNEYRCHIPEIRVTLSRTLADLVSAPEEHSARALKDICERFNVPASRHDDTTAAIRAYLEERMPEGFFK